MKSTNEQPTVAPESPASAPTSIPPGEITYTVSPEVGVEVTITRRDN